MKQGKQESKKKEHKNKKTVKKTAEKAGKPIPDMPSQWLYLASEDGALRTIYERFRDEKKQRAEFWQEADILEIAFLEAGSMDLELLEGAPDPEDTLLRDRMNAHGAKAVYTVEILPEPCAEALEAMQYIIAHVGGVFCGDTEDLTPEVGASVPRTEEPEVGASVSKAEEPEAGASVSKAEEPEAGASPSKTAE